jgi:hypothetical protein
LRAGPLDPDVRKGFLELNDSDAQAYAAVGLGFKQLQVTANQIKAIQVPILVIYGSQEMPNNQFTAERLSDAAPNAERKIICGEDHMTAGATDEYVDSVFRFLQQ